MRKKVFSLASTLEWKQEETGKVVSLGEGSMRKQQLEEERKSASG